MNDHGTKQKESPSELIGRQKTQYLCKVIKNSFREGEEVRLRVTGTSKRQPIRIIKGEVMQKNNFLVFIKTNIGVESFRYSEFLENRAKII